ncbi:MAG: hypothetical protein N2747_06685 [Chitinophagaceae bacterium]|nr:hypothetical protein [Chitinophagaceae bacterium]
MHKVKLLPVGLLLTTLNFAQNSGNSVAVWDGIVIAGYVNDGAFVNFTGPNINVTKGHYRLLLGALPSLRIKKDQAAIKNATIFPALGVGLTFCKKAFALQVPFYYNSKTSTQKGKWHIGIGIGVRTSYLNKNKKT